MLPLIEQVILKKTARKPYAANDFSFKPLWVATSADVRAAMWTQEMRGNKAAKVEFDELMSEGGVSFPDAHLTRLDSLKEYFMLRYKAGEVGNEYIGHHGVPGFAWPSLDCYDANHAALVGAPRFRHIISVTARCMLHARSMCAYQHVVR